MEKRFVYMDYNATTPLHPDVKKAMIRDMDIFANASSMHEAGRNAKAAIDNARASVARIIGAKPEEIVFTSGGSESNNTVFQTALALSRTGARTEILTTTIEHPCVMNSAAFLKDQGLSVQHVRVDSDGRLDLDELKSLLSEKTLLVSVMMANNEIGTIQDIAKIAKLAHDAGALFHTDAVQAIGKIPVNVVSLDVDYLTMSCHKLYGPKGIGALYIKHKRPISPFIRGGHQEQGIRAGTYNNLGIIGFGVAADLASEALSEEGPRLRKLREKLRDGLLAKVPDIKINGHPTEVLPNTLNVSFPGAEGEAILLSLDFEGIEVSTGSACASGSLDPSHVLMAIGAGPELAHGSIRFSMGRETLEDDIEYLLEKIPPIIKRLRGMSTLYSKF